jgi:hypothetical protein
MSDTAAGPGDASHSIYPSAALPAKPGSPIGRLPNELMVEIFLLCLPDCEDFRHSSRPSPTYQAQDAPLLLCSVCHSWRQLAITTCSLWSTIIYRASDRDSKLQLLRLWLSRSGLSPIVVHIEIPSSTYGNVFVQRLLPLTMSRDVKMLLPSIGRWRELVMQGDGDRLLPLISVFPSESLTALAALEVDCGSESDKISPLWSAIPRSAPLRSLKLSRCSAIPAALQTDPCLVTHIELRGVSVLSLDSYLQPLRVFPNLRDVNLYSGYGTRSAHVLRDPIHLPTVVSFQLKMSRKILEAFLTRTSAPALRNLCIEFGSSLDQGRRVFPVASFMDFLSGSSPPLRKLIIRGLYIKDPDFLKALKWMGSIVELRIEMSTYVSAGSKVGTWSHFILRALCVQEEGIIVLPSLQHITLVIKGAELTDLHVEMIRSRWDLPLLASRNVTRLREVEIGIPSTSTSTLEQDGGEPLRQLRLMEAEGLSLITRMTGKSFGDVLTLDTTSRRVNDHTRHQCYLA